MDDLRQVVVNYRPRQMASYPTSSSRYSRATPIYEEEEDYEPIIIETKHSGKSAHAIRKAQRSYKRKTNYPPPMTEEEKIRRKAESDERFLQILEHQRALAVKEQQLRTAGQQRREENLRRQEGLELDALIDEILGYYIGHHQHSMGYHQMRETVFNGIFTHQSEGYSYRLEAQVTPEGIHVKITDLKNQNVILDDYSQGVSRIALENFQDRLDALIKHYTYIAPPSGERYTGKGF